MAVVTTTCRNPKCSRKVFTWRSQPNMPGTQIAAGNFLLCFGILMAGGSASKVLHINFSAYYGIRMYIFAFLFPLPESKIMQ